MIEKYGLVIYWDVRNNYYVASVPEILACSAVGKTRREALEALEAEVEEWRKIGHEMGHSLVTAPAQLPLEQSMPSVPDPETTPSTLPKARAINKVVEPAFFEHGWGPLTISRVEGSPVISLSGYFDVQTCSKVNRILMESIEAGERHLILNLSEVSYMDSAGLGTCLQHLKYLRSVDGALLCVWSQTQSVNRLFQMTRLELVIVMCDTLENALSIRKGLLSPQV